MTALWWIAGGYLAGSIPFAVAVSRVMRLPDPRTYGSGNIGATNVLRSGNRRAASTIRRPFGLSSRRLRSTRRTSAPLPAIGRREAECAIVSHQ